MIQRRSRARFFLEALSSRRIIRILRGQDFQSDCASEFRVGRPVDFSHSARTEPLLDSKTTKARPGCNSRSAHR